MNDSRPLAERMRPSDLSGFVGQRHLLDDGQFLANAIKNRRLPSLILWGPPGTGKTTLGRLLAKAVGASFVPVSAVTSGVKVLREKIERADEARRLLDMSTVLFVDEIHRFNKAQQDSLLPHVEKGTITLIGATTETPSFEVNAALLSRCRMLTLKSLSEEELETILATAMEFDRGLGTFGLSIDPKAVEKLVDCSDGDARFALTALEAAADAAMAADKKLITPDDVETAIQKKYVRYDKSGDQHYNTVSAFIKSMRGSDPDAALYYMIRMMEGGEDPIFIFRRMIIFASEDIGNADPQALSVVMSAFDAFRAIGLPEGALPMTQAATYLSMAPKSNAVLTSYAAARKDVMDHPNLEVPAKIRDAHTKFHQNLGHGRGYKYPHNFDGNYTAEDYLPDALIGRRYYQPSENGYEAELAERLQKWRKQ